MKKKNCKYKCDICGRPMHKKIRIYGHTLCSKHMHQMLKYGKCLDANPRAQNDLNAFRFLDENTVEFDVYNQKCEVVNHFLIDADDLAAVRYHKWRVDTNNHVLTGNCTNSNPRREISRMIMNCSDPDLVVDHIDGNPLNNRKANLRICTQQENLCNKHFMSNSASGEIGIHWDKARRRWAPEIQKDQTRYHLGRYKEIEEARFVRYIAEQVLFQDYRNKTVSYDFSSVPMERRNELSAYVILKLTTRQ